MSHYEYDAPQAIPIVERNEQQPQRAINELGLAALKLRDEEGLTYTVDKRSIELTFASGDSAIVETTRRLDEAKTKSHQNKLQANVIGNGLINRLDARASLVKGAASTTERTVQARLGRELTAASARIDAISNEASDRINELEIEAEEKIHAIREQLERDKSHVVIQRDGELADAQSLRSDVEAWGTENLQALTSNRDDTLLLFEERAAEISRLMQEQVEVNGAVFADLAVMQQKLAQDRAELDRLRMRASELYDNYIGRMRDKEAIDERVVQSGKALDQVRQEIHDTEIELGQTVMQIGKLEMDYTAAVDYAKNEKYPGNPSLGAVLLHKDPHVSELTTKKRTYAHHAAKLNNHLAELAEFEQARIQNRRPLLTEQGNAIRALEVAERSVQESYRMMLRLKKSIADECAKIMIATQEWMARPVEITVETDDITEVGDEGVIGILTKGMSLGVGLDPQRRVPEEHDLEQYVEVAGSLALDDDRKGQTGVAAEAPLNQQRSEHAWKMYSVPLIHRVVDAKPSPGIITMQDGTEVVFTCDTVSSNQG